MDAHGRLRQPGKGPNLELFANWLEAQIFAPPHHIALIVASWLPDGLTDKKQPVLDWVLDVARSLLDTLQTLASKLDTVKPNSQADSEDVQGAAKGPKDD